MLGGAIAACALADDGLGLLTSGFGRTRLAEAPLPARARAKSRTVEKEDEAGAARAGPAAAMRP